jgi:hypothetical protein
VEPVTDDERRRITRRVSIGAAGAAGALAATAPFARAANALAERAAATEPAGSGSMRSTTSSSS